MPYYRIAWRALATNVTGHGEYLFNNTTDLQSIIDNLNREHAGEIIHWFEQQLENARIIG